MTHAKTPEQWAEWAYGETVRTGDGITAVARAIRQALAQSQARVAELTRALEYYADEASYEDRVTLQGNRGPGVMRELGGKARQALAPASESAILEELRELRTQVARYKDQENAKEHKP